MNIWSVSQALLLMTLPSFAYSADPAAFEIKSIKAVDQQKDDDVKVAVQGETVVFDLHEVRAIGGITIAPKTGTWPKTVVFKVRLRGLENLQVDNGKATLVASVLSHSGHKRLQEIREGKKQRTIGKDDPLWAKIRILDKEGKELEELPNPDKGSYFEVTLPPALFEDGKVGLTVHWIDFLRR